METVKTPGLIAVKCVLSKDGKPVGIGHGSSAISRINKGIERTVFGCLNGALMSAVNSACKTFDVERLASENAEHDERKRALGEAYWAKNDEDNAPASPRQVEYLRHLLTANASDEERDALEPNLDTLSRADASELISRYATR